VARRLPSVFLRRGEHAPLTGGGADQGLAVDAARLDVKPERGTERIRPDSPVGDRDEGVDVSMPGGLDPHRDRAEGSLLGSRARQPQAHQRSDQRERGQTEE
jgi:hypothetical protein